MENLNKERHGCVTTWLIFMIIANSITAILYLFAGDMISQNFPGEISTTTIILLGIMGIINIVFAILLLNWNKIGFWGFLVVSIAGLFINLSLGLGIGQSLLGLIGIIVLFGVLQIKKDNVSAWDNLD
ncbi:hypothetical protein [uncultured Kordia sp.]|uniref:hypothetical protein n=1 Tax=uncultured Kordia sp. TaxID=507699 RepID=UPI002615D512|nr:hypothetical protein [uncultured Kordia sp.]